MTPYFIVLGLMILGMAWEMYEEEWARFSLYLVLAFLSGLAIYFKLLSL
jgi:hypothetical protein